MLFTIYQLVRFLNSITNTITEKFNETSITLDFKIISVANLSLCNNITQFIVDG